MKGNFRGNAGIQKLHKRFRKAFRIQENLNHYSDEGFKNAERNSIKHGFLNGKIEVFAPDHPVPQ
ncbi:MAG: hypothetical protein JRJ42_06690 [Deltaproteobacteria bacterium]|nr:hypothetical protein [Deltaproteobacteria bacterium]MBW2019837.1 hypothetical protein [Deltaproteobacteria bacterium]MBW2074641.1 hypothetical protein [Deltaproteobacteria bacterium]RLB80683.1 MAG: hypothetical protein DRH17_11305 [Deltaproteobacteria bacterium]